MDEMIFETPDAFLRSAAENARKSLESAEERNPEDYGCPAIIGLSDLRKDANEAVFEGAQADRQVKTALAFSALIYTSVITDSTRGQDCVYPPIATAMGHVADRCFYCAEDGTVLDFEQALQAAREGKI